MSGVNPNQLLASIERNKSFQRPRERTRFNGDLSALDSAEGFGPSGVDLLKYQYEEYVGSSAAAHPRSRVVPLPTVADGEEDSENESESESDCASSSESSVNESTKADGKVYGGNAWTKTATESTKRRNSSEASFDAASRKETDVEGKSSESSGSDAFNFPSPSLEDALPDLTSRHSAVRRSTKEHTAKDGSMKMKSFRQSNKGNSLSRPASGTDSGGRRTSSEIIASEMQDAVGDLPSEAGQRLEQEITTPARDEHTASPSEQEETTKKHWRKLRVAAKTIGGIKQVENDMRLYGVSGAGHADMYDETDPRFYKQTAYTSKHWFIMLPRNRFRRVWEALLIAMLLYVVFTVPVRVCFDIEVTGGAATFDLLVDVLFILDIFVNVVCAYEDSNGELIVEPKLIVLHYMRTWFILDVVASVPIYRFVSLDSSVEEAQINRLGKIARLPRLLRLMKLLRLLKLLRVFKLMRYFQQWERHNIGMNGAFTRMFKVIFGVFLVTHLIGCFWYFVAWAGHDTIPEDSWIVQYGIENHDDMSKYLSSIYWSFSTLTTIGYGDVRAFTNREKIFSIVCMVVGVSWYAFVISTISSIMTMFDRRTAAVKRKQRLLVDFMRETHMPWAMRRRIMTYFDYATTRESSDADPNEMASVLSMLSTQLRTEVTLHVHRHLVPKVPFFLNKSPQFIASTVSLLRPLQYAKGDYISTRGQHADEMYFLIEGRAVVVLSDGRKFKSIIQGSYFGEIGCMLSERHRVSVVAASECHVYALSKADLRSLMDEYPDVASEIRFNAKKRLEHVNRRRSIDKGANSKVDMSAIRAQNFITSFPGVATRDDDVKAAESDAGGDLRSQLTSSSSYTSLADSLYDENDDDSDYDMGNGPSGGDGVSKAQFKSMQAWLSKVDRSVELLIEDNRKLRGSVEQLHAMLASTLAIMQVSQNEK
ncbi:Potassium/sodium hyperpolarization-activated cyclic nucleotide-gated channel 1 [Hondaea fermentalgiana]|uniref:Potassium/sodium hyperpolarization-activated cyclic nucleotide-gated channel 1 n=1 Tax=Hondaea fermentalgiana TaxID=2315210 RepID=A0A2R5GKH3_9STRA|nr:Potassium/sodium hyperpolarization-activated cyclic nucleotide-gated channel 1 [Hondaea fermentalgiana]|eukprot:GBG31125.1 Potassium/sodium hyperpolarization-activated cyclic nucleotide-gated channel 1 [Hondaea fermentalgiana]